MSDSSTAHIGLDTRGIAWIDETNIKVIEVVLDSLAYGWSPEEIHSSGTRLVHTGRRLAT